MWRDGYATNREAAIEVSLFRGKVVNKGEGGGECGMIIPSMRSGDHLAPRFDE
ncbi:unnamed protein product [Penicillium camemberti]|uniref:Str. FM013 n=1 Tax=Penicillium camemberti (strain FM 013) TaxID=1429867 RepID=A0A0G4PPB1_PENC3|nr:unnamed protein product [Penicillium camemberti]